jgi:hypothetical protein
MRTTVAALDASAALGGSLFVMVALVPGQARSTLRR